MKKYSLQTEKRSITGRKVKSLRAQGILPATVYGKKITSENISVALDAFLRIYKEAGETGVVELTVSGATKPVLIHHVQYDPVDSSVLHVEFYQVDLKEKVRTKVPIEIIGESPAVSEKRGVVLALISEVEVEALPTDLPERIDVDVSVLSDVDQEIQVSGISVSNGVKILTDAEVAVVKIGALISKEAEAQVAEEAKKEEQSAEETKQQEGQEAVTQKEGQKEAEEEKEEPAQKKI